mgnify:CR=1 FL=1
MTTMFVVTAAASTAPGAHEAMVSMGMSFFNPEWAEDGMLGVRRCVTATLAADHRATDGHQGALFLEALNRHLNLPETL